MAENTYADLTPEFRAFHEEEQKKAQEDAAKSRERARAFYEKMQSEQADRQAKAAKESQDAYRRERVGKAGAKGKGRRTKTGVKKSRGGKKTRRSK